MFCDNSIFFVFTSCLGAGFNSNSNRHAYDITLLATQLFKTTRSMQLSECPAQSINLQAGIHTGPCTGGLIHAAGGSTNYTLLGEAVDAAMCLQRDSLPHCIHASKKTTHYLSGSEFNIVARTTYKLKLEKQIVRTCWVAEK